MTQRPRSQAECHAESLAESCPERDRQCRLIAEWSSPDRVKDADERVSAALIPPLLALYGDSEEEEVRSHLKRFRRINSSHLSFVERQHADDRRVAPLLKQPELPLILDRLEADPRGLLDVWPLTVPRIWLEALAEAWGRPF